MTESTITADYLIKAPSDTNAALHAFLANL